MPETNIDPTPKALTARLKEFFGLKPGQTIGGFVTECKELTETDKNWFKLEFAKMGLPVV